MKAAILTAFDPYEFKGGIETYIIRLVRLLESCGIQVDLYYTGMADVVEGVSNDLIGRAYSLGRNLLRSATEYDYIIANSFYGLGYFPPKGKIFNVYHSTHIGFAESQKDVIPHRVYLEWKLLCGELCETVSGFNRQKIAVSESVRSELERYYGFEDIEVVPHGIDLETFIKYDKVRSREKYGIPKDAFTGTYVGRWDATKGCNITAEVIQRRPEVCWLLIVGTGSDKSMLPAGDNIIIIEHVDNERMGEIYSAADFMLFPSRYEAFGYVIIEAMACELPVITTNVGIARTIHKAAPFNRLLLPDFSEGADNMIASSVGKIDFLQLSEDWRNYIGAESRKIIKDQYSIERWNSRMSEVLGL